LKWVGGRRIYIPEAFLFSGDEGYPTSATAGDDWIA
jgi:hypothetical protein